MENKSNSVLDAVGVIQSEIRALEDLIPKLSDNFSNIVRKIIECKGKIVVSGIGKSGHIGRKISSTLASTGTPSYFLHPAEAIHGDLGILSSDDLVILISHSGESKELTDILPSIKRLGIPIIAFVGNKESSIGKRSDYIVDISVETEACPMNLTPTSSTTATLVMGDALAIALLKQRNFNENDFALRHPGGQLGKKLILTVDDLMHREKELPLISISSNIKDILMEMTSKKMGVVGLTEKGGTIPGIITDGDLRRCIEKHENIFTLNAGDIMTKNPKTITKDKLAMTALKLMEEYSITNLFVLDDDESRIPVGLIHIHDILKAGLM